MFYGSAAYPVVMRILLWGTHSAMSVTHFALPVCPGSVYSSNQRRTYDSK